MAVWQSTDHDGGAALSFLGIAVVHGLVAVAVFATAVAYWVLIGSNLNRDVDPASGLKDPYPTWQVVRCGAVVLVVAVVCGLFREVDHAAVTIGTTLVGSFSISGFTDPMNDGLWVVGAMMVAAVVFPGVGVVAAAARFLRNALSR